MYSHFIATFQYIKNEDRLRVRVLKLHVGEGTSDSQTAVRANNALLGDGVRAWIREQRKIKRRSKED